MPNNALSCKIRLIASLEHKTTPIDTNSKDNYLTDSITNKQNYSYYT